MPVDGWLCRGRKPRILFVSEAVTLSHVVRPLVLSRGLDRRKYDLHIASNESSRGVLDEELIYHPIQVLDRQIFDQGISKGINPWSIDVLRSQFIEDLRLIDEVRPDLIVGDARKSLGISARVASIPYVGIANAYFSPFANPHYVVPDVRATRILGPKLAQMVFTAFRSFFLAQHVKELNVLKREYGLPKLKDFLWGNIDADYVLYSDAPEFVPTENLPSNHYYLGPINWSPEGRLPVWWNDLLEDKPIIYVNLGSSGNVTTLREILTTLAELPVTVMAVTAGRVNLDAMPSNVFVTDFIDGDKAARRAALMIGNGGSPSSYQAVAAGIPVIGIAYNLDQYLNMYFFERAGVGVTIRSSQATGIQVRDTVKVMLSDPRYQEAAKRASVEVSYYRAPERFAQLVEQILGCEINPEHRIAVS